MPNPIRTRRSDRYCQHCGSVGTPKTHTKGAFLIEIVLWLCFFIPGMIYTLWRLTSREKVCPNCGAPGMIPVDSPKARGDRSTDAGTLSAYNPDASPPTSLAMWVVAAVVVVVLIGLLLR